MKMTNIAPGVRLCLHKTEQFKSSVVSFNIITSLGESTAAKALLCYLLSRTNKHYPTLRDMNRRLCELYGASLTGSVRKIGEAQVLSFTLVSIDDRFALGGESILSDGIDLLSQCIFTPDITPDGFKKENIEREKRLLKEKIDSERDDKRAYALSRMLEEMCCDEIYAVNRLGKKEDIDAVTEKELFNLWKDMLFTCPVQINVTGNFNEKEITAKLSSLFSPLERKKENIREIHTEILSESYDSKTVTEKQPVKQGKLVIGMRAGMTFDMDNFAAIKLMTAIFGSGTFSKLFMNVREKMSLCYYCSARLINTKGIVTVESGVETENAKKALDAIRHELDEVKKGNFTDETIENAKRSLCDSYSSVTDSVLSINEWMLSSCLQNELLSPEAYADMINGVCREEIILAASMVTEDTVYILESEDEENA